LRPVSNASLGSVVPSLPMLTTRYSCHLNERDTSLVCLSLTHHSLPCLVRDDVLLKRGRQNRRASGIGKDERRERCLQLPLRTALAPSERALSEMDRGPFQCISLHRENQCRHLKNHPSPLRMLSCAPRPLRFHHFAQNIKTLRPSTALWAKRQRILLWLHLQRAKVFSCKVRRNQHC
jgi:hypothetical protein